MSKNKTKCEMVLFLIVFAYTLSIVGCSKSPEKPKTNVNYEKILSIYSSDYLFVSDGWIYYDGLFRARTEPVTGTNRATDELKLSNNNPNYLLVDGYWLFFSCDDGIYRVRTDGTDEKKLSDAYSLSHIAIADSWLFFLKDSMLCRIRVDGSEFSSLQRADCFTVTGGYVYYTERYHTSTGYQDPLDFSKFRSSAYRMNLDGTGVEALFDTALYIENMIASDTTVNFWTADALFNDEIDIYLITQGGFSFEKLASANANEVIQSNGWLYWFEGSGGLNIGSTNECQLYRMRMDGTRKDVVFRDFTFYNTKGCFFDREYAYILTDNLRIGDVYIADARGVWQIELRGL